MVNDDIDPEFSQWRNFKFFRRLAAPLVVAY